MKISIKPKYFPLIQKPLLCNVTCLQMILFRRGHKYTQDFIAKGIGNYKGYKTIEHTDKINSFFKKEKLSLKADSFKISQINEPKEFIIKNIKESNDIWIEVANKPMWNSEGGHDVLIQAIDTKTNKVTLVDPERRHEQISEVDLKKLIGAMNKKWGRERGFVIISRGKYKK